MSGNATVAHHIHYVENLQCQTLAVLD